MKKPTLRRFLWYLFAVPRCSACHHLLSPGEALSGMDVLCSRCRGMWEQEKLAPCSVCGEAQIDCRCMPEVLAEAGAETLLHLGEYRADAAVGQVILRLKDAALRCTADFAAAQLVPAIRRTAAACDLAPADLMVTYLPRSRRARRKHGHDQAELVARALAARLGAEFAALLRRAGNSRVQKTLSAAERQTNVSGAFAPAEHADCAGRAVFLVDDVVTTGASMAEGVRILRGAGAERVICVSLGLTAQKKTENVKK